MLVESITGKSRCTPDPAEVLIPAGTRDFYQHKSPAWPSILTNNLQVSLLAFLLEMFSFSGKLVWNISYLWKEGRTRNSQKLQIFVANWWGDAKIFWISFGGMREENTNSALWFKADGLLNFLVCENLAAAGCQGVITSKIQFCTLFCLFSVKISFQFCFKDT